MDTVPDRMNFPRIDRVPSSVQRPHWSVMLPVYQPHAEYFKRTLESVLSQADGESMQIEVVDDASPDHGVEELVHSIGGPRIRYHRHARNQGLTGNWNSCITRAHGQWVHILHQDDLVRAGFYRRLREGLEHHPSAQAAFCRFTHINEAGTTLYTAEEERSTAGLLEEWLVRIAARNRIQCPAIVVRRRTYETLGGYHPGLTHAMDWEMWVRIAAHGPVYYEPEILADFRQHEGSTTSRQMRSAENIRDVGRAIRFFRQYLPKDQAWRITSGALLHYAKGALWVAAESFAHGQLDAADAQIRGALSCSLHPVVLFRAARLAARVALKRWRNR